MRVLIVDNYDSFTYNLVHAVGKVSPSATVDVWRNDAFDVADVLDAAPAFSHLILSPGPMAPEQAGQCVPLIRRALGVIPILGVCLGHQCLGSALGARIVRGEPVHGMATRIYHDGRAEFAAAGVASPFEAARYHSLIVARAGLPASLEVTAWSDEPDPTTGEPTIMAMRTVGMGVSSVPRAAREPIPPTPPGSRASSAPDDSGNGRDARAMAPAIGWQFHPESFMTEDGSALLRVFLSSLNWRAQPAATISTESVAHAVCGTGFLPASPLTP